MQGLQNIHEFYLTERRNITKTPARPEMAFTLYSDGPWRPHRA